METEFDTIYDLCSYYYESMRPNEVLSLSANIHKVPMTFHIYRIPDYFVFDSSDTVNSVFSLCESVDTATQVIIGKNIAINSGVVLTPPYRCKGMVIFDYGTLINDGRISMTSRGCIATGQNIYLFHNAFKETYEFVPAIGASGGAAYELKMENTASWGRNGNHGTNRRTGGGGNGGSRNWMHYVYIGRGGNGTSYSGGAGAGAGNSDRQYGWDAYVGQGSDVGGAGSAGVVSARNGSGYSLISTGGQGNPNGGWASYRGTIYSVYSDVYGTGGLLIVYCNSLVNNGNIQSNGGNTMYANASVHNKSTGGASGGGSVNIFYTNRIIQGVITATGGQRYGDATYHGGLGGNGCVTVMQIYENARKNSNIYKDAKIQENFDYVKVFGGDSND